ncbi:MAG: hypothetical protein WC716_12535 [Chitinophagaceae bacterium]
MMLLLMVAFTAITKSEAQTAVNPDYSLESSGGKLVLKSEGRVKVISENSMDTLPVQLGSCVYYAHNEIKELSIKGVPYQYNIKEEKTAPLLLQLPETRLPSGKIVAMMADKQRNRLYYSLKLREEQGMPIYTTILYDGSSVKEYMDGMIESIDKEGRQTIIYYDVDPVGPYFFRNIYTPEGTVYKSFDKEYPAKASK